MKALAILALVLVPVSVHAQKAAKELAADCAVDTAGMYGDAKSLETNPAAQELLKSPDKLVKFSGCMEYIRGVIDTWLLFGYLNEKTRIEMTANYTPVELKDAFMSYLKEHPETTPRPASLVIFAACKEHNMIRFAPATKEEKKP
jgi:hypothetical protein